MCTNVCNVNALQEPYFKSEPVPEPNDGPVKIAVAKNFQSLVADSKKDVLVPMLYKIRVFRFVAILAVFNRNAVRLLRVVFVPYGYLSRIFGLRC